MTSHLQNTNAAQRKPLPEIYFSETSAKCDGKRAHSCFQWKKLLGTEGAQVAQWSHSHRSLKIKICYLTARWSHERHVRKIIQSSLTLRYLYHWFVHPIAQRCFQAVEHNGLPIKRSTRPPIKQIDVKTAILHEQCMCDSVHTHTHTTWTVVRTKNVLLYLLASKKIKRK